MPCAIESRLPLPQCPALAGTRKILQIRYYSWGAAKTTTLLRERLAAVDVDQR